MEKMDVLTFTKTDHILAVITRASQADKVSTVEDVAVSGFKLRDSGGDNIFISIPVDELSVKQVDFDTRVLYQPHSFALEDGKPEQKSDSSVVGLTIGLTGTHITATLPVFVSEPTDVWSLISGGNLTEQIVRKVTIPGTVAVPDNSHTEELTLGQGEYRVAMYAPGYAVKVFLVQVP